MNQTSKITCPSCKHVQEEDIETLTMDTGEMDGEFPYICEKCKSSFTVKFEYKPFIITY